MPTALYCVLCDRVEAQDSNLVRLNISGLLARVRPTVSPPFPLTCNDFRVFLLLTDLERFLKLSVRVVEAATGSVVHVTRQVPISSPGDPRQLMPVAFRIHQCRLPAEGLYWVECLNEGTVFVRQRLYAEA